MERYLSGKTILIIEGSLLAGEEIAEALSRCGARVHLTTNFINAFSLLRRMSFDGAVVDQGLHNEAFDLCSELRELDIPYFCCSAPHRLHTPAARKRDADQIAWRLSEIISGRTDLEAEYCPIKQPAYSASASPSQAPLATPP